MPAPPTTRSPRRARWGWSTVVLATLVGALSAGAGAGVAGSASAPPRVGIGPGAQTLSWHRCDQTFRCATLTVPISYTRPDEGSLKLAVIELPATGGHPIADIITNPGGPGGSGVQFLEQSATQFPASLRRQFTLVSFDPRGVGASDPVRCVTAKGMRAFLNEPAAPQTPAQVAQVVASYKTFAAACVKHTPADLLANVSTTTTARDMDRLRAALGQSKLTYYGASYGTYLGTVYAELFPQRVRALVLDGAVDPAVTSVQSDLVQSEGFEQDLQDFFAWCTAHSSCAKQFSGSGGVSATFTKVMDAFNAGKSEPAYLIPAVGGTVQVGSGLASYGVVAALYASATWSELGQAIAQAAKGNATDLGAFALQYGGIDENGHLENILEAYVAISCLDAPMVSSVSAVQALLPEFTKDAPDFGPSEAWSLLSCDDWPDVAQSVPAPAHDVGAPPVVVVGSTHDPATPYVWAQALASQLSGAVLLTRTGDGHTGYFFSSCIQRWVDRYFVTLATPPPGTVCSSGGVSVG